MKQPARILILALAFLVACRPSSGPLATPAATSTHGPSPGASMIRAGGATATPLPTARATSTPLPAGTAATTPKPTSTGMPTATSTVPAEPVASATPQPPAVLGPPRTPLRALLVSPTYDQDGSLFGLWSSEPASGACVDLEPIGGLLYVSCDGGSSWRLSTGGLPQTCAEFSAIGVSPDYGRDHILIGSVVGHGLYRSDDGAQSWQPSSSGITSTNVQQVLFSPAFARDQTMFARVGSWEGPLYRSTDGGHTWQALGVKARLVALSPEFGQDHTMMAIIGDQVHVSQNAGETWGRLSDLPAGKYVSLLSLAPLFARWRVLFASWSSWGNAMLYRSADGAES